jgi:hypothetical protein
MPSRRERCLCVSRAAWVSAISVAVVTATSVQAFAQGRAGGGAAQAGNPACNILTPDELRTLTGFPGYKRPNPGDPAGQGAGGGASCQYESTGPTVDARGNAVNEKGPLLSLVLIEGKNYTKTMPMARGCKKEVVSGVGDEAFFEVCPSAGRLSRTPPLYVKAGTKDLIVQMDIDPPDTEATMRPKVVAVAKAAAAKVR